MYAEMRVAAVVAGRLAAAGVRRVFGFPGGGGGLELVESLREAGIAWTLCHSETAAALMACATAELTAAPGVVVVGNGPGLTSVVNGVAHARLDRVPLIVLSDRWTDAEAGTTGHQVLDQRALLAPLVKSSATLEPARAAAIVDAAIAAATAPPAGPAHIDVPGDVMAQRAGPGEHVIADPAEPEGDVPGAAAALMRAARPVMLVGLEARGVAPGDLRSLAHRIGAAVLTTYKGKGAYPEDDARWGGILTGGEIERPLLGAADVLLAVGLDPVELLSRPWRYDAPVISLSAGGADGYLRPRLRLAGDVGVHVRRLLGALPDRSAAGIATQTIAAERDAALRAVRVDRGDGLPAWRVVETVARELPAEATVTVDAGAHMFAATYFCHPRRFLISNGLATMGFALPAALAAALARPHEPALAFTGDGGMAYHLSELETAARLHARLVVVVLNDAGLGLIRIKHEARGFGRAPLDFERTRFDLLATGLGVIGRRVDDLTALAAETRAALAAPASTVIDVSTTGHDYAGTLAAVRGGPS
jgi:acetolactate synthase-1/2/3 large subunit